MDHEPRRKRLTISGVLLGLGLGGFFDGIVLHQILQWHHMVSHVDDYPTTTVAGLEANTLGDGLFHAATWVFTVVGLFLLWVALRRPNGPWSTRAFVGLLLLGWGLFNVVEGIVDHYLLELHHVREDSANQLAWDLGFLAWGAAMVVGGWLLWRSGQEEMVTEETRAASPRATAATTTVRRST
jgi:uncharacterized membrane protein